MPAARLTRLTTRKSLSRCPPRARSSPGPPKLSLRSSGGTRSRQHGRAPANARRGLECRSRRGASHGFARRATPLFVYEQPLFVYESLRSLEHHRVPRSTTSGLRRASAPGSGWVAPAARAGGGAHAMPGSFSLAVSGFSRVTRAALPPFARCVNTPVRIRTPPLSTNPCEVSSTIAPRSTTNRL
jgi:hypothetical protein